MEERKRRRGKRRQAWRRKQARRRKLSKKQGIHIDMHSENMKLEGKRKWTYAWKEGKGVEHGGGSKQGRL